MDSDIPLKLGRNLSTFQVFVEINKKASYRKRSCVLWCSAVNVGSSNCQQGHSAVIVNPL